MLCFSCFLVLLVLFHHRGLYYPNHQKEKFEFGKLAEVLQILMNSVGHEKFGVLPSWQKLTRTEDGLAWIHFVTKIATRIQNSTILIHSHENDDNENEKWHQLNPFSLLCYDCNIVALRYWDSEKRSIF